MSKKILSVISILIITFSFLFVTACNGMNDDNKGKVDTPKTPPVSSQDTTPVFYDYAAPDFNRVIDGMTLTFFDEFDGTELDLDKWIYERESWYSQNGAVQRYRNSNVSVNDGLLTIEVRNKNNPIDDKDVGTVTSGAVKTQDKFSQTYGRIEARMRVPTYTGAWPCFWMMPQTINAYGGGWPYSGEIDIAEFKGRFNTRVAGSIHNAYSGGYDHAVGKAYYLPWNSPIDRFHVYALIWTPDYMDFEVDGVVYQRITKEQWTTSHYASGSSQPFDRPFYITFSCGVGGILDGHRLPDLDNFSTSYMQIDYLRVYQFNEFLAG